LLSRKNSYLAKEAAEIALLNQAETEKSFSGGVNTIESPKFQTKVTVYNAGDKIFEFQEKNTTLYASDGAIIEAMETHSRNNGDGMLCNI
jgi:hypothetical protein